MIKRFSFTVILLFSGILYAGEHNSSIIDQELQKAIEQEKKFAKEQTFYNAETYDFKGAEVNKDSLTNVPLIEMDDPGIDSDAILGMSEEENLSW
jgi:hypothetical protein